MATENSKNKSAKIFFLRMQIMKKSDHNLKVNFSEHKMASSNQTAFGKTVGKTNLAPDQWIGILFFPVPTILTRDVYLAMEIYRHS